MRNNIWMINEKKKSIPYEYTHKLKMKLIKMKDSVAIYEKSTEKIMLEYVCWFEEVENYLSRHIPGEINDILEWESVQDDAYKMEDAFNGAFSFICGFQLTQGVKTFDIMPEEFKEKIKEYISYKINCWKMKLVNITIVIDTLRDELDEGKKLRKSITNIVQSFESMIIDELIFLKGNIRKVIYFEILNELNKENYKEFIIGGREYCMPDVKVCRTTDFQYYVKVIDNLKEDDCAENRNKIFENIEQMDFEKYFRDYKKMKKRNPITEEENFINTVNYAEKRYATEMVA